MNLDNMNEEQYKKLVQDISDNVVEKMMKVQKQYDEEFRQELEKKYGYQVEFKPATTEWVQFDTNKPTADPFKNIEMEKETIQWEISMYEEELKKAVEEERYEDAEKIKSDIGKLKEKFKRL